MLSTSERTQTATDPALAVDTDPALLVDTDPALLPLSAFEPEDEVDLEYHYSEAGQRAYWSEIAVRRGLAADTPIEDVKAHLRAILARYEAQRAARAAQSHAQPRKAAAGTRDKGPDVLAYLRQHGATDQKIVIKAIPGNPTEINKAIQGLAAEGKITRTHPDTGDRRKYVLDLA